MVPAVGQDLSYADIVPLFAAFPRKVRRVILAKLKSIEKEVPSPERAARLTAWLDTTLRALVENAVRQNVRLEYETEALRSRLAAIRVQDLEHQGRGAQPTAEMLHARRSATAGEAVYGVGAGSDRLVYHNRTPRPDEGRGVLHLNRSG